MPDLIDFSQPVFLDDRSGHLYLTPMRVAELALQRFLNDKFLVASGYPVPVIFAHPSDALNEFTKLWRAERNPFEYLLQLKDSNGNQVYQPYPAAIRYPLISVKRLSWRPRPNQSYGIHRNRRVNWPTVNGSVARDNLAWVSQHYWPNGWDFRWQIEHQCNRPDTQAIFVSQLKRALWMMGGTPQTYINVRYHFPHGDQWQRLYLEGDIDDASEEAINDTNQICRTSFNLVLEGYSVDYQVGVYPSFWKAVFFQEKVPLSPDDLNDFFDLSGAYSGSYTQSFTGSRAGSIVDVRIGANNPSFDSRRDMPPDTLSVLPDLSI